ncbi:MAG: macro domain-containing protein [Myxococcota bacterium]
MSALQGRRHRALQVSGDQTRDPRRVNKSPGGYTRLRGAARDARRRDLLDQPVEVIVNAWNRNLIPWWLLLPQGVSGAIKRRGGTQPFREVARHGPIPLGGAVRTGAGALPFRAIIHVAAIDLLWRASERSIHDGVVAALRLVDGGGFASVAFPVLGAGSGGFDKARALEVMQRALAASTSTADVRLVRVRAPS